jgi:hypothetical protein
LLFLRLVLMVVLMSTVLARLRPILALSGERAGLLATRLAFSGERAGLLATRRALNCEGMQSGNISI